MTVFEIIILVILYMIMYGFALENLKKNSQKIYDRFELSFADYLLCLLFAFAIPITLGRFLRDYLGKDGNFINE